MNAIVEKAKQPLQQPIGPAYNTSAVKGKTLWLILFSGADAAEPAIESGFKAAASAIGAKAVIFDGKGSPDVYNQGIHQAIAQHAGGIMLEAIDPSEVPGALADAAAAHVPVVDSFNGVPDKPLVTGLDGHIGPSEAADGALRADFALAATGCKTNALYVVASGLPTEALQGAGGAAEFKRLCPPTNCKVTVTSDNLAKLATTVPGDVAARLQRDPSTNYIIAGFDAIVPLIEQGEHQVGKTVHIVGGSGDQMEVARQNGIETGEALFAPLTSLGWFWLDTIARAMVGQHPMVQLQLQLFDKSNWGTAPVTAVDNTPAALQALYPKMTDYAQQFKKIWGVG